MAFFKYTAFSADGQKVNGVIEAPDRLAAAAKIKQTYPVVENLREVAEAGQSVRRGYKKVAAKELSMLCKRFSIVLSVGLPIVQAVDMMAGQTKDKNLKRILKESAQNVAMGRSLSASFAARRNAFPVTFLETVRSGEESGDLSAAFTRLSEYYEKASKTRKKVTSALIYPAFVLAVAIVVIAIIMIYAVPSFTTAFSSLGTELPGVTRFVIGLSNFTIRYGVYVLLALAVIIIGCKLYSRTPRGAAFFSSISVGIPVMGKIIQLNASSQFAHTMSMMLTAGMPIIKCMNTAGRSVSSYVIRRDILGSIKGIEEGRTLGSCMSKSRYLPAMLVEMTAMGEATGTLETTLKTIGDYYDNEVEVATARAVSLLEPIIICFLAVFVVIVLFSVYMPMFSMYGSI